MNWLYRNKQKDKLLRVTKGCSFLQLSSMSWVSWQMALKCRLEYECYLTQLCPLHRRPVVGNDSQLAADVPFIMRSKLSHMEQR